MEKEIKYNGYTATPSDYESPDGDLVGIINGVPEDGEVKPILPPTVKFALNTGEKVLWIHKMTGRTHYIISLSGALKWISEEDGAPWTRHDITGGTVTGTPTVSSIGNTLIVNDNDGVKYFLWSTEGTAHYEALGQKPPMLEITFGLHSDFAVWPETKNTGTAPSDFKGTEINVGRINDSGYFPKLGDGSGEAGDAWVWPQPVMANWSVSGNVGDRIRDFANMYATFSVEGKDSTTESLDDDMLKIKNMLSNGVFAGINKFVNEKGTEKNKFVMPFFVRYAYRLYDDSYIMHSYPVLMIPNSRGPIFGLDGRSGMLLADYNSSTIGFKMRGRVYGFLSDLVYSIVSNSESTSALNGLRKWKDIITSVDIGVSAPIWTYDQAGYVYGWTNMDKKVGNDYVDWDKYYSISRLDKVADETVQNGNWGSNGVKSYMEAFKKLAELTQDDYFARYDCYATTPTYEYPSYIATVPQRSVSDINNDLTGATNFYIIKQIDLDDIATGNEQSLDLDDGVLGGLLGRSRIEDDYHTHDTIKASLLYNYNGRMNYSGIERLPHSPLNPGIQFPQASSMPGSTQWQISVSIKNEEETLTVQSEPGTSNIEFPRFIYYPDRNAKYAYVTKGSTKYKLKLAPHDFLNGAYWLGNIMSQTSVPSTYSGTIPTATTTGFKEENKLYTSNVNNPFSVPVTGITTVGTGEIMAICSATKALSQGQFGQFPLYAFTTEGVWALETSSTGTFTARQPVTRDVCTYAESITQLDDSVLFATDRGIMLLSGSTTLCITDEINNTTPIDLGLPAAVATLSGINMPTIARFTDYLKEARMTYDYTGQRIIVFNPTEATVNGVTAPVYSYAYVYSLKDKKWGMMESTLSYPINSYPEALAVTKDNKLVNLSQDVNNNESASDDVQTVSMLLVTRPLKLDQGDVMKTVNTIIQRGKFDYLQTGRTPKPVRSLLMGSRDLYHWHMIWSSADHYLRGFSGTPYKYFRVVVLGSLAPDESLFGCSVNFVPKLTNQLR